MQRLEQELRDALRAVWLDLEQGIDKRIVIAQIKAILARQSEAADACEKKPDWKDEADRVLEERDQRRGEFNGPHARFGQEAAGRVASQSHATRPDRRPKPGERVMKWQPIETAPKDEYIIVWPPTHRGVVSCAIWDADKFAKRPRPYWRRFDARSVTGSRYQPPTHWMRIPAAPEENTNDN